MSYTIFFIYDNRLDIIICNEDSLRGTINYIRRSGGEALRVRNMYGEDFTDY